MAPIAAVSIVLIMIGAIGTKTRRGDVAATLPTIALALIAAVVARGRLPLYASS